MAIGDVRSDSFDFYEGIRITLPGGLAAALVEATLRTVGFPSSLTVASSPLSSIAFSIGAGLLLYFLDVPSKALAYRLNQPTDILAAWFPHASSRERLQFYFVVLDTHVPGAIRSRSLYMGSIFRIGFEAILLLALFQFGVWGYSGVATGGHIKVRDPVLFGFFALLCLILALRTAATLTRTAGEPWSTRRAIKATARIIMADIGLRGLILLLGGGALCTFGFVWKGRLGRELVVAGASTLALLWLLNYMWGEAGFPRRGGGRPSDGLTALLLFLVPTSCLIWEGHRYAFPGFSSNAGVIGWLVIPLVASVLIAARGHERRLGGAYATQRHWLEMHRARIARLWRTGEWDAMGRRAR